MEADNGILRGFKQQVYEGGIRTPWIVSWPNKFKGGRTIDTPVISFDILPTVMDALELSPPEAKQFDGKSILPLIDGKTDNHHEALFWDTASPKAGWAVRQGEWKLRGDEKGLELYNLTKDPSEKTNLAKKNADRVEALHARYKAWRAEMAPPVSQTQQRNRRNR